MCSYQTLYHQPGEGYVIHCRQCNHLQLAFGNVSLSFNKEGYSSFLNYLRDSEHLADADSHTKSIRIPTPYEGMQLLLSGKEMKQLICMMDTAETEFKSLQLLELFNAG